MAKGKLREVRIAEDIPVYLDDDDDPAAIESTLTITTTTKGRVRFEPSDGETFEIDLDELVAAILHVDTSGGFAQTLLGRGAGSP